MVKISCSETWWISSICSTKCLQNVCIMEENTDVCMARPKNVYPRRENSACANVTVFPIPLILAVDEVAP